MDLFAVLAELDGTGILLTNLFIERAGLNEPIVPENLTQVLPDLL